MATGNVNLTIADGGAVVTLPAAQVQVVMGCCSSGTANTILATSNAATVQSTYGYGPAVEYAGLAIAAGATVLMMRLPTVTAGAVVTGSPVSIVSSTNATPIVVTATAHGLLTGDVATIAGHTTNTAANGTWVVTKLTADTFSIAATGNGIGGATGTVTWTGAKQTGTGTSSMYFSGAAYDDSAPLVTVVTGGTIGTTGIQFTVALDAGRSTNLPRVNLGTATTYVIPQTNLTLNFESTKTLVAGDTVRCTTTAPLPNVAGITAALTALAASPYASSGWGSMVLVGKIGGSDAGTVGTNLETLASTYFSYDRMIGHARDASPPVAWGGSGETDSTWSTSVLADFASTTAKRFAVDAGYYNMRSAYSNPVAGLPIYRRPLAFAHGCRIIGLPRRADGADWIALGALSQITVDQVLDPVDGWVYHNERDGAVFCGKYGGAGRMGAARTVAKRAGYFMTPEMTLAATGSQYALLPDCRLIDDASGIVMDVLMPNIGGRVKVNANGTILDKAAAKIESDVEGAWDSLLADQYSGRTAAVDRTWDVKTNNSLKIAGTIIKDGRIFEINFTLALA